MPGILLWHISVHMSYINQVPNKAPFQHTRHDIFSLTPPLNLRNSTSDHQVLFLYLKEYKFHEMIAKSHLDSLPPFPDDVPTAPIVSASLSKLLANDDAEAGKVLEACQT